MKIESDMQNESETLPMPAEIAQMLRESGLPEDDVLDLLREAGDLWGWTAHLDMVGLIYCKPEALTGKEKAA